MSFSRTLFTKEAKAQGHSYDFIQECLDYAQALIDKDLPVLFSTYHLAHILNIKEDTLRAIIIDRDKFYKYYPIKKKRGGVRQISTPYNNLKTIQRWILTNIISKAEVSPHAKGFVTQKGIKDNAAIHEGQEVVLNIDLLKFFESISEYNVYEIFTSLGYSGNVAYDLAQLTTVPINEEYYETFNDREKGLFQHIFTQKTGVLPQGAPTSPALSNIALIGLDNKLNALAQQHKFNYSRYADDMTFSGNKDNCPKRSDIHKIIREERLFINWEKGGKFLKGQRQLVTGLTVTHGIHVPKKFKKEVARHIHFCKKFGPDEHLRRLGNEDLMFYREWLLGKILFIKSIESVLGNKLLYGFNQITWPL
jgi:retron-type reverse transcriptase